MLHFCFSTAQYIFLVFLLSLFTYISGDVGFKAKYLSEEPLMGKQGNGWYVRIGRNQDTVSTQLPIDLISPSNKRMTVVSSFLKVPADLRLLYLTVEIQKLEASIKKGIENKNPDIFVYSTTLFGKRKMIKAIRIRGRTGVVKIIDVVAVPKDASYVFVTFRVKDHSAWQLRRYELFPAEMSTLYKFSIITIIFSWLSLLISVYCTYVKRIESVLPIIYLSITGFCITFFAVLSKSILRDYLYPLQNLFIEYFPNSGFLKIGPMLEFGHTVGFFILTLLLLRFRKTLKINLIEIVFIVAAIAVASEAIQVHTYSRNADLYDVLLDIVGLLFGFMVFILYRIITRKV